MRSNNLLAALLLISLPFGLLLSCGKGMDHESNLDITNGRVINENSFPAVVRFGNGTISCTGAFITQNRLLTAAHCVRQNGPYTIRTGSAVGTESIGHGHPTTWSKADNNGVNQHDVGIVMFPANTAPATIDIATRRPNVGDGVTIVGYGCNESINNTGSKVKRRGTNTIENFDLSMINIHGETGNPNSNGVNSAGCSGDSGGPILRNGLIVGVTSGGTNINDNAVRRERYTDISSSIVRNFLFTPWLKANGKEEYTAGSTRYVRFKLHVGNWHAFPNAMFLAAPDLPPCGRNRNASRTWVDIYNAQNNKKLYGFCAFNNPSSLQNLWFAAKKSDYQRGEYPKKVYIKLRDRRTNSVYKSKTIKL